MPTDEKIRKRMVVEEVPTSVEEIKEKVEELQTLTEDISNSVEKSVEVQEDLVKAAEGVIPAEPTAAPQGEPQPIMPQIRNSNTTNPLVIIIPGLFLLGALLGGIYFYQKGISGNAQPTPTPLTTYDNQITGPSTTPVATTAAAFNLAKYPINVMNGSGVAGQAGVVKTLLTTAGFTISKTGNASSYDFTKTVIKAKTDVPAAFITQLSTALSKSYVLDTNQALATSSADEVQIIIGSTKAK